MFAGSPRASEIADGPEQKNRETDVGTQQSLQKKLNLGVFSGQLLSVCHAFASLNTVFEVVFRWLFVSEHLQAVATQF